MSTMIKNLCHIVCSTVFLLLTNLLTLQAQVSDDFSDGNFTTNPIWSGDAALFVIDNGQLRSNSSGANTYYLSTPSSLATDAQWEFFFDFQFGTSGANYCDVYLLADNSDLNAVNNGYFLRIGGTADELSLYRMVGGSSTQIIDGTDGLINSSSANPFNIRITRSASNDWNLEYDDGATGTYVSDGVVNDNSVTTSTHFGLIIKQSSAASPINSHFFDNFEAGNIPVDVTPPSVTSVAVLSNTEIDVKFDESVDATTAQNTSNYNADNGLGNPSSAVIDGSDPSLIHLTFSSPFTNGQTYQLTVQNITDLVGNIHTGSTNSFLYFVPDTPSFKAVVINEILPDPTPQVGLLDAEFIELHNVSTTKFFDLNGWVITDGSSNGTIGSYVLGPGEFVILCSTSNATNLNALYGNALGVPSFPSLNNGGETLQLKDASANLIDEVTYSDTWYNDGNKEDGGWSLELINPELPCESAKNWTASNDVDGGTPGSANSVYDNTPDITGPVLQDILVINNTTIQLVFDEAITALGTYPIVPAISIANAGVNASDPNRIDIALGSALDTGEVYVLTATGDTDCSGNTGSSSRSFILPASPKMRDIIINEVLFNPVTGGDDFIELYNNSSRTIDLFGYALADFQDDTISNNKSITAHFILYPSEYVVVTEDSANIQSVYPSAVRGKFIQTDIPSYANSKGNVYLIQPNDSVSDFFNYTEDWHFALLNEVDGVSLERIDFDQETNLQSNWHSAAESVGFATPGYKNSQYFPGTITDEMVKIDPELFSPDNDGFEDVLSVTYSLDKPGYIGNITIYDVNGRIIKNLMQNELLAAKGRLTWDGISDNREKARIGAYVLFFEVFDTNGTVSAVKKVFSIGGKF